MIRQKGGGLYSEYLAKPDICISTILILGRGGLGFFQDIVQA